MSNLIEAYRIISVVGFSLIICAVIGICCLLCLIKALDSMVK